MGLIEKDIGIGSGVEEERERLRVFFWKGGLSGVMKV